MKRNVTSLLLGLFLAVGISQVAAQDDKYGADKNKCINNLSLFNEAAKAKNYEAAYEPWLWVMDNCPKASKVIYSRGLKIAEDRYEKATGAAKETESKLIEKVYEMRIKHFPDNLGKVYNDWASSLEERGKSDDAVFAMLDKAFKTDPSDMSIKNLAKYFKAVTERNKDTNTQLVFDTYDDGIDAVNTKIDKYTKSKDKLEKKIASGAKLGKKESKEYRLDTINLIGLGQVEGIFDDILGTVATCERLIPLYNKGFEDHKTDAKWLRRAASRLNAKECTDDPIFPKLVEAYVNAEPSADAYVYYAQVLEGRGKASEATTYRKKAVDLETDPYKKAKLLYSIGTTWVRRSPSQAAKYAREALQYQPSMGRAYLLIARAYAASVNSCGNDEFTKRMVYIAAANKALQAKRVDPSLSKTAGKYYSSYSANGPSKKLIFQLGLKSGASHRVGCWIGETVRIP